jgi:hypothetical protein
MCGDQIKQPDTVRHFLEYINKVAAEFITSTYSSEDLVKIRQSLHYLHPDEAALENACAELQHAAMNYRLDVLNSPGQDTQKTWSKQRWARIFKISEELLRLLLLVEKDEIKSGAPSPPECPPEGTLKDHQVAAVKLLMAARRRLMILEGKIEGELPQETQKANPRQLFQCCVLTVWTNLGGKLQISRHPIKKNITGPLARYFAAATQPVCGGSIESLPDILARQKAMSTAIKRWRAKDKALNGDPPRA